MKQLALAVLLVGCGAQDFSRPVNETFGAEVGKAYHKTKDGVGKAANKARKHLSDRGLTVEAATEYAEDKGFTKENVQGKLLATRKNVGAYANDKRKAWYRKGIKEMRHGDIDHTTKTADNTDRITAAEAAIAFNAQQVEAVKDDLAETEAALLGVIASLGDDVAEEFAALIDWIGSVDAEQAANVDALGAKIEEVEGALTAAIELLDDNLKGLARSTYSKLRRLQIKAFFQGRAIDRLEDRVEELEEYQCEVEYESHTVLEKYYYYNGHRWQQRVDFNTIYIPYFECGEED